MDTKGFAFVLFMALNMAVSPVVQSQEIDSQESDKAKIEQAAFEFVAAYNQHDAAAIAKLFSQDAELQERRGGLFIGRDEIEQAFVETFGRDPKAKISLSVDSVRLVTPDVAVEDGVTTWFPDGETPTAESMYRAAHVNRNGKWLIASVRTIDDEILTTYEYLRDLEWMIGDWMDEGEDAVVETNVRWGPNRAYLLRGFKVKIGGESWLEGTQRIGWDSQNKQFRSWAFDSEGGFVEGLWTRVGDGYVIRSSGY